MNSQYLAQQELLEQAKQSISPADVMSLNKIDIAVATLLYSEENENNFASMSKERQLCLATFDAEGHINSGGLVDFFQYTSDEKFAAVVIGYETFGSTELLKIIQKAVKKFPKSPPLPDHESREEILNAWDDKGKDPFSKLDQKFMSIGSALVERMSYILQNQQHFFK